MKWKEERREEINEEKKIDIERKKELRDRLADRFLKERNEKRLFWKLNFKIYSNNRKKK